MLGYLAGSSLLLGAGCGGSDDVAGGGDGMHGVLFTSNNAPTMLGHFASVLDLTLSVNRAESALLTAVDAATKTKSADISQGTLSLVVLDSTETSLLLDVTLDLTSTEVIDQQSHTLHISGRYACAISPEGNPVTQIVVQDMVAEQTDTASQLVVKLDGIEQFRIGCFNFYYIIDPTFSSFRLSEPLAVFSVPGPGVMTEGAYGLPMLVFDGQGVPVAGVTASGDPFSLNLQWSDIH